MRILPTLALGAACMLAGFAAGGLYRSHQSSSDATLEDYALGVVLGDLSYAHYLASGDRKTAHALIDTSLHANLNRIRQHAGANSDPAFTEAKIRTLSAVAFYWQANPPFTSDSYKPNETNTSWIAQWRENQTQNLVLLSWAQRECMSHPEYKCKQR